MSGKKTMVLRIISSLAFFTWNIAAAQSRVSDERRPPILSQLFYDGEVSEAASIGTAVLQTKAFDYNGGQVSYSIVETGRVPFVIDKHSGMIIVDGKLDRERQSRFSFSIRATNANGLSSTASVDIIIEDVNDKVPEFVDQPYIFTVMENDRVGYVGRVRALDGDQGRNGIVTYSVAPNDLVQIDPVSGELLTTRSLDYEKEPKIILEVIATDNGIPPLFSTALVTIEVENRPDTLPVFQLEQYEADVPENEVDYPIVTVEALSPDPSIPPTYVIRQGPTDKFVIDPLTGTIRTRQGLDFEKERQHILIVGTRENGDTSGLGATTTVVIDVMDRNDNAPAFINIPRPIRVPASIPIGYVVTTISASDSDSFSPANVVRYEIIGSDAARDVFSIDQTRGVVQTSVELSKRTEMEYVVDVRAYDLGVPQLSSLASLVVIVDRAATVSPEAGIGFAETIHAATIPEDAEANTLIRTLLVANKPSANTQISCEVTDGNQEGLFYAKQNMDGNCELRLSRPALDHELKTSYTVNLRLSTPFGLVGRGRTTARVDVTVMDVNDNGPAFQFPLPEGKYTPGKYWGAISTSWRPGVEIVRVFVGVVQPHQEIMLVVRGSRQERVKEDRERILEILQTRLGLPVRILSITEHQYVNESGAITVDSQSTDLIFYCIDPEFDRILPREQPQIINGLMSDTARVQISNYLATYLSLDLKEIRGPIDVNGKDFAHVISASIMDWNGIPIALIAFAALVAVIGVIASIYVCTIWSRYRRKRDERPSPVYFVPTFPGVSSSSEFNPKPYEVIEMSVTSGDSDRSDDLRPGLMPHRQFLTRTASSPKNGIKRPPSTLSETVTARTSSMPRYQANSYSRSVIYNHSIEQRDNNYSIIESPIPTTNPLFRDLSEVEDLSHETSPSNGNIQYRHKSRQSLDYSDYESKTVL